MPADEQSLLAELAELAAETAPRRFALCALDVRGDDGAVIGWGLAFDAEVIAYLSCGGRAGSVVRARTAIMARRLVARLGDVRLIWLDEAPPDVPLP